MAGERMTPPMKEDVEVVRGIIHLIEGRHLSDWTGRVLSADYYGPALSRILAALESEPVSGADGLGSEQIAKNANCSPVVPVPAGWRLVPEEPYPEMVSAWYRVKNGHHFHDEPPPSDTSDYAAYRAMLAAAPSPRSNHDDR